MIPNCSIAHAVAEKIKSRSRHGILKYGTTLDRNDLSIREWLVHAQEEAMDLANYLEKIIQELDARSEILEKLMPITEDRHVTIP
jgi:hypothetical protein